ncbi:sigma-70 family RNA polymerase sigma factor [Candidatus Hydrogenedentota bacterium]
MSPSETYLLDRWRENRDADAFAELVSIHSGMVYSTCRRVLRNTTDAEDVAQECFLQLMETTTRIRSSLGAWLHTVAVSRALDRIKSEKRRARQEKRFAAENGSPPEEITVDDVQAHVDEAIAKLSDKLKVPVIKRFLEGGTHTAIAAELGVAESTVRLRVTRGVEKIRANLKRRGILVSAGVLSGILATSMVEAAPASLIAGIGKLTIAGGIGTAATTTGTAAGLANLIGGMVVMKKFTVVVALIVALLAGVWIIKERNALENQPADETAVATTTEPDSDVLAGLLDEDDDLADVPKRSSVSESLTVTSEAQEEVGESVVTGSIRGRIYDAETGDGLGAFVYIESDSTGEKLPGKPSRPSGEYELTELPDGRYALLASANEEAGAYTTMRQPKIVTVRDGRSVTGVNIALEKGILVTGTVVDTYSQPVQGASVELETREGHSRITKTKSRGTFRFVADMISNRLTLYAESDTLESDILGPMSPRDEGLRGVILKLTIPKTASVAGFVEDQTGAPVSGVFIHINKIGSSQSLRKDKMRSDDDGAFGFYKLGPGQYRIEASSRSYSHESTEEGYYQTFELVEGEQVSNLRLLFNQGPYSIAGRVMDTAGNPINDVYVDCQYPGSGHASTNEEGEFAITGMNEGVYALWINDADYSETYVSDIPAGSEDVTIVMKARASVEGRVLSARTNRPVTSFDILVSTKLGHSTSNKSYALFDTMGRFSIDQVTAGRVTITVESPGFSPVSQDVSSRLREHETLTGLEFRLEPALSFEGTVVDSAGTGIPGALIYEGRLPDDWDSQGGFAARSLADGAFTIESTSPTPVYCLQDTPIMRRAP